MDTGENDGLVIVSAEEQLRNEFDYLMAQQMLKNILEMGLVSADEFNKISALNCQKLAPELASILP